MKVLNFQDPTHKSDFGTTREDTVFHLLTKLVGNQYLEVLRMLVPREILILLEISAQFERHYLCSTEYFSRSHTSKRFYDQVTIPNFPKRFAQNTLHFLNSFRTTA